MVVFCEVGSGAVGKRWPKSLEIAMNALIITHYSLEFQQDIFNLWFEAALFSCSSYVLLSRAGGFLEFWYWPSTYRASITDFDTDTRQWTII